jgi:cell division protein FtsB
MTQTDPRRRMASMAYFALIAILGGNFGFAAIQGDYGVFRQAQTAGEISELTSERDRLAGELDELQNLTKRLSDHFLDMDLLDEQVRSVLGYVRADEIVIR